MNKDNLSRLEAIEKAGDFDKLIKEVKATLQADRTAFSHSFIQRWCGIRWRNLFLTEALKDKSALKKSDKSKLIGRKDKRADRQKLAEQFLRGDEIREWHSELPDFKMPRKKLTTTLVFSPGLINGMLPVRAFQTALPEIEEELGLRILRSDNHPMRSCRSNVSDLLAAIEGGAGLAADTKEITEEDRQVPGDIFLIGYSKGAPDIYELLVARPDLKDRIRCIYNWGGAIGGSYLADDIYNSIKDVDIPKVQKTLSSFLSLISPAINLKNGTFRRMDEYDIKGAVRDLTTTTRGAFLEDNAALLESLDIPVFNVTGSTTAMEVPYFQMQGVMELNKYDAHNDMQLTQAQAKIKLPMAADLAMLRAHHWDMSYDAFPKLMRLGSPNLDHPFPKKAAMKAMIMLAIELGLVD